MSKKAGEIIPNKSKPTFDSSIALSTRDTLRKQSKLFAILSENWVPSKHEILFSIIVVVKIYRKYVERQLKTLNERSLLFLYMVVEAECCELITAS